MGYMMIIEKKRFSSSRLELECTDLRFYSSFPDIKI